ncbi:MAG: PHP domain-containing protein, partial [Nitratireductor sp.]|nr:PHP domain-containing protein [Nitratireductor sp.]
MAEKPADTNDDMVLAEPQFVHLRVHSAYSLLEGALPLKKVIGFANANRMPAIAIADSGNLFGALEFAQKASEEGVQPIVGCQLDLVFEGDLATPKTGNGRTTVHRVAEPVVLIAATEAGYANLVEL